MMDPCKLGRPIMYRFLVSSVLWVGFLATASAQDRITGRAFPLLVWRCCDCGELLGSDRAKPGSDVFSIPDFLPKPHG